MMMNNAYSATSSTSSSIKLLDTDANKNFLYHTYKCLLWCCDFLGDDDRPKDNKESECSEI